jgi:hypothetical protein
MDVRYSLKARAKFDSLFFLSDDERKIFADPDISMISWFQPHIHVSREKLLEAIEQVELLGDLARGSVSVEIPVLECPHRKEHARRLRGRGGRRAVPQSPTFPRAHLHFARAGAI